MLRSAKWRKEPATEGQKALVAKRMKKLEIVELAKLTKGEAANIISRVKHGAKVGRSKLYNPINANFVAGPLRQETKGGAESEQIAIERVQAKNEGACTGRALAER